MSSLLSSCYTRFHTVTQPYGEQDMHPCHQLCRQAGAAVSFHVRAFLGMLSLNCLMTIPQTGLSRYKSATHNNCDRILESSMTTANARKPKVIVIELDACDPHLVRQWSKEGRLPFLTSLIERGTWVDLVSGHGFFPDAPWTVFNTGVVPAKTGFFNFLQLKRGTTDIIRVGAYDVKRYPFWWLLRDSGKKVAVFDAPKTYPIEGLHGVQVAGWGEHYPLIESCSLPADLLREVVAKFGVYRRTGEIPYPKRPSIERRLRDTIRYALDRKLKATQFLMDQEDWDLFVGAFGESHYAGHQFYHHFDRSHWAHDPAWARTLHDALPTVYMELDAALGTLLQGVSADTTLFVVSVHGIDTNYSRNHLMPVVLEKLGWQVPADTAQADADHLRTFKLTQSLRNLMPQSLRDWINTHVVPESFHDQVCADQFRRHLDWKRSRAFFLPSDHFQGFISVNVQGREPFGTVRPGDEYDAVCAELITELKRLTDPDTGTPAVRDAVQVAKIYRGEYLFNLPDIVIYWAEDGGNTRLHHPKFGVVSDATFKLRKSQHTQDGFLIAVGKHIDPNAPITEAHILDVAPTLLHLFGETVPNDMDGTVLLDLLDEEFKRGHEVKYGDRPLVVPRAMQWE
jgi:predicted AlkP superfamily phosphohydrolase/phosphomutase